MATKYKNPPTLDDDSNYDKWKQAVDLWMVVTDIGKNKRGAALALSVEGKASEIALNLDRTQLNCETGVDYLLKELDKIFEKDKTDKTYETYEAFDKYKKNDEISMIDYINNFEQNYNKCKKFSIELPDAVLAYKILDGANLTDTERKLALTACTELKYDLMKTSLRRIFASQCESASTGSEVTVKTEEVNINDNNYRSYNSRRGYSYRGRGRGRRGGSARDERVPREQNKTPSTEMNPSFNGIVSRCSHCDSKYHWYRDCPHKAKEVNMSENTADKESEEVNVVLMTNEIPHEVYVAEARNFAIIDTACSRTVCGSEWLKEYLECLSAKQFDEVEINDSKVPFKFGDGKTVFSYETVKLPAKIGSRKITIETEVVPCKIPLLLSKDSLKRAHTVIDIKGDSVMMFGEPIEVSFTSCGHYCISILDTSCEENGMDTQVVLNVQMDEIQLKKNDLSKLHRQFGHASSNRLWKLLQSTGKVADNVKELLDDVVSSCVICHKFKRAGPKPAVAFSHANDFNQIVALDLHEISPNLYYLHVIDLFSRLSAASIIRSKSPEVITDEFMKIWVGIYGSPEVGVYTDNGGEFNNELFLNMAEKLNISVKTTAAYSPFSNGVVERHNAVLTEMLTKVKQSENISWETALIWAIHAKNCLINVYGFSPFQIVYGRNPNLPSNIVNKPPALESSSVSQSMAKHLNALHSTRAAFVAAESLDKIKRALKHKIRPKDDKFKLGDIVFFDRNGAWKGPGTVIGQDNVVVFVRYGGTYVRVHQSKLLREHEKIDSNGENTTQNRAEDVPQNAVSPATEDKSEKLSGNEATVQETDDDDDSDEGDGTSHAEEDEPSAQPAADPSTTVNQRNPSKDSIRLKNNQIIQFSMPDDDVTKEAIVISRAGKATTGTKNWYNVKYLKPTEVEGKCISIDMSKVNNLEVKDDNQLNDTSNEEILLNDLDFTNSKLDELKKWRELHVYESVMDEGQPFVTCRWVNTVKNEKENEAKLKSRLVARGFEDLDKDIVNKNSPTCDKQALRVVLSVIAQRNWKINTIDIKTAFLQGEKLEREVYILPPKEANESGKLWRLKKCVYGLSDASLKWYNKVKKTIKNLGGEISDIDPAVFYWHCKGQLAGIVTIHVDDFLWGGSPEFENKVIKQMKRELLVGKEESEKFKYIGLELSEEGCTINLNQRSYVASLSPMEIERNRANDSPLSNGEKTNLRAKIGQLLWLAKQSRPDIAFNVTDIAGRVKNATVEEAKRVNKIIKKVKSEEVTLKFQPLGQKLEMHLYTDASFGNLSDGGSQGGYVLMLKDENDKGNLIGWQSKRIRRVVKSTLASEALALSDGIDNAFSLASLAGEIIYGAKKKQIPIHCHVDNNDLVQAIHSKKNVSDKRLRIEINSIKEMIEREEICKIKWIESQKQIANSLTKKDADTSLLLHCIKIGKVVT